MYILNIKASRLAIYNHRRFRNLKRSGWLCRWAVGGGGRVHQNPVAAIVFFTVPCCTSTRPRMRLSHTLWHGYRLITCLLSIQAMTSALSHPTAPRLVADREMRRGKSGSYCGLSLQYLLYIVERLMPVIWQTCLIRKTQIVSSIDSLTNLVMVRL